MFVIAKILIPRENSKWPILASLKYTARRNKVMMLRSFFRLLNYMFLLQTRIDSVSGAKFCQGKAAGKYGDPDDCFYFYTCVSDQHPDYHQKCSVGTAWDWDINSCNFEKVDECTKTMEDKLAGEGEDPAEATTKTTTSTSKSSASQITDTTTTSTTADMSTTTAGVTNTSTSPGPTTTTTTSTSKSSASQITDTTTTSTTTDMSTSTAGVTTKTTTSPDPTTTTSTSKISASQITDTTTTSTTTDMSTTIAGGTTTTSPDATTTTTGTKCGLTTTFTKALTSTDVATANRADLTTTTPPEDDYDNQFIQPDDEADYPSTSVSTQSLTDVSTQQSTYETFQPFTTESANRLITSSAKLSEDVSPITSTAEPTLPETADNAVHDLTKYRTSYFKSHQNREMIPSSGHLTTIYDLKSPLNCGSLCVIESNCTGFNFQSHKDDKRTTVCQLVLDEHLSIASRNSEMTYYEVVVLVS